MSEAITIRRGDCWMELHCGDSREIAPRLNHLPSAIITDPPYGMGWKGNQRFSGGNTPRGEGTFHEQILGDDEDFDPAHWLAMKLPTVMWGANHFWHRLPKGAALVWQKRNDPALGTFLSDAEIAYLSEGHGVYVCRKVFAGGGRAADAGAAGHSPSCHPNQKPVSLMAWCMARAKVNPAGIVLDPFMGSGTTGIACMRTGRKFIGIEKDPVHFQTAVDRIRKEANQGEFKL